MTENFCFDRLPTLVFDSNRREQKLVFNLFDNEGLNDIFHLNHKQYDIICKNIIEINNRKICTGDNNKLKEKNFNIVL